MYELFLATYETSNDRYVKSDIDYGYAGTFDLGLKSADAKFTLEERKLLKLINHYYITLKGSSDFEDNMFYIPKSHLDKLFSTGTNPQNVKASIIETISRLNNKKMYWDFTKSKYKSKLKQQQLITGTSESLVDITIVYQPWGSESKVIKGIVCKVTNFLRLRYTIRQIANNFPTTCLQLRYLDFMIADRIIYHLKLKQKKNNKGTWRKSLRDLLNEIYYYDTHNDNQTKTKYLEIVSQDKRKPRELLTVLEAITNVGYQLKTNNKYFRTRLLIVANNIKVMDVNMPRISKEQIYINIIEALNPNEKLKSTIHKLIHDIGISEDNDDVKFVCKKLEVLKFDKDTIKEIVENAFDIEMGIDTGILENELLKILPNKGKVKTKDILSTIEVKVDFMKCS